MQIRKPVSNIPKPSSVEVLALAREIAPDSAAIPQWVLTLATVAYQNGRYDEASQETFAGQLR